MPGFTPLKVNPFNWKFESQTKNITVVLPSSLFKISGELVKVFMSFEWS